MCQWSFSPIFLFRTSFFISVFRICCEILKAKRNNGTKQVVSGKLFKDNTNVVKIKSESKGLMKY